MDWNFDIENFERLLKEKADEFRMYPSKRVWHSVYNNIHPGRKWPSLAMSITLIGALLLTGYLNTKTGAGHEVKKSSTHIAYNDIAAQNPAANLQFNPQNYLAQDAGEDAKQINDHIQDIFILPNRITTNISTGSFLSFKTIDRESNVFSALQWESFSDAASLNESVLISDNTIAAAEKTKATMFSMPDLISTGAGADNSVAVAESPSLILQRINTEILTNTKQRIQPNGGFAEGMLDSFNALTKRAINNKITTAKNETKITADQKAWMESFAVYNRPVPKNWNGKLSWQANITPSVVYRNLYSTVSEKNINPASALYNNNSTSAINTSVAHKPSYGLQLGAGVQYSLFKWLKIRTGLQVNYTRYNAKAYNNGHPVSTTLTMVDENSGSLYEVYRSTPYSNIYGLTPVKLHNQSLQISIPVGVDVRLGKYENLEWYAGSSLQPSLLVAGKSYYVSSDKQNYVADKAMLRRFNMSAAFETYISYKAGNGYTWQVGPEFRTQLFSNNKTFFALGERLQNYGLKIGVSKKF